MKRVIIFIACLTACLSLAAQSREVKGVVIYASDSQPVIGAEVKVKGTDIQTVTDVDGKFVLEVPADASKLRVSYIGMETRTVRIPENVEEELLINVRREERIVTPFVQIGVNASRPKGDDGPDASSTQMGFTVGAGVSFAISHHWSITPSVNLSQRTARWENEDYVYVDTKIEPLYLDIPILAELKLWGKNNFKSIISVGPYISFGVGGQYTATNNYQDGALVEQKTYKGDLFGDNAPLKRFDAGIQFGIGWQVKHVYFGFNVQYGLTNIDNKDFTSDTIIIPSEHIHNFKADFSIGYRF